MSNLREHIECFVVLEGLDVKHLRYVCLFRDFEEAHIFCKTALTQLQHKLHIQAHVERYVRASMGNVIQLIRDRDHTLLSQYVVQKVSIL